MVDYAVVVGVADYPHFEVMGSLKRLRGPDPDAAKVAAWLAKPTGGNLPPENIRVIRTADFPQAAPGEPQPAVAKINSAMQWLMNQTAGGMGGRLYLYFSGHGFAPVLEEPALFTAEATDSIPAYVYAYDWFRWFRKARRFREYVLWMDCCMTYQKSITPSPVMGRQETATGKPGPAFMAVASQTRSALEHRMDDGEVHGVFTWTLLTGLEGGAADERGRVTGESLKAFLHNAMPEFLPEEAKRASVVDLQPFVRADPDLEFVRFLERPKFPTELTFPPEAVGHELRLWSGRPHSITHRQVLSGTAAELSLVRGLYVAEVPGPGLRQGFTVTGAGPVRVAVARSGPPVLPADPSALHRLRATAENPGAQIDLIDGSLEVVFRDTGTLAERDMPGVYKIRTEIGRDIAAVVEDVIVLDRDFSGNAMPSPPVPSPAPIPDGAYAEPAHSRPFLDSAWRHGDNYPRFGPATAAVSILGRYWFNPGDAPPGPLPHPLSGLELVDAAGTVVDDLSAQPLDTAADAPDPMSTWERLLEPGAYYLRQTASSGRSVEGTVMACGGWVTQIALQHATAPARPGDHTAADAQPLLDGAVFMRPSAGNPRAYTQDKVVETARIALAEGRDPLGRQHGGELQRLLLESFEDPMGGIIGAHLLLRSVDRSGTRPGQPVQFDAAIQRLRTLLGGVHPDVEALSLRCWDPALRQTDPFTIPPLFRASWQLLTTASYSDPGLIDPGLWQRVHATTHFGPFLVWATDEASKTVHQRQLLHWFRDIAASDVEHSGETARSLGQQMLIPRTHVDDMLKRSDG